MIEALLYCREDEYSGGRVETFWTGIVAGHPETNGSGETEDQAKGYVVFAWNRDNPENPKVLADFDWTVLTEQPDWA